METAYDRGYADQTAWLQGKTLAEAEHALDGRQTSVDNTNPYNRGALKATKDFIAALKASA